MIGELVRKDKTTIKGIVVYKFAHTSSIYHMRFKQPSLISVGDN